MNVRIKELIRALYDDFDASGRSKSVKELISIGPMAVTPLFKTLNSMSCNTRRAACRALGKIGDTRAITPLIRVLGDEDPGVRREAVQALTCHGMPLTQALIKALEDKSPVVRANAALVLGHIKDATAADRLVGLLEDKDMDVRKTAAVTLESRGWKPKNDIEKVYYLIAKAEKNWKTLASLGSSAIGPLCNELRYKYKYPRINTEKSLIEIGKPAVASLAKMLCYKNINVREIAAKLLGDIGDAGAVEPLIEMLKDKEKRARLKAVKALMKINDPKAIEPLVKVLEDREPEVRLKAAIALDSLGWRPKLVAEKLYYFIAKRDWKQITSLKEVELEPLLKVSAYKNLYIRNQTKETLRKVLAQTTTIAFGSSSADNQQNMLRRQDTSRKMNNNKMIEKIFHFTGIFSKNISKDDKEPNSCKNTLHNPDVSRLTIAMNSLNRILIDTATYDFHFVERFITYAVNHVGRLHLKRNVEVHIYGDPGKLHGNLKSLFESLLREVVFYKKAAHENFC